MNCEICKQKITTPLSGLLNHEGCAWFFERDIYGEERFFHKYCAKQSNHPAWQAYLS